MVSAYAETLTISCFAKLLLLIALFVSGCAVAPAPVSQSAAFEGPCEVVHKQVEASVAAVHGGKGDVAEVELQSLSQRAPHCVRVRLLLAMVFREKHNLPGALEQATEAVRLAPNDALTLNVLAEIYSTLANRAVLPDERLQHLTQAMRAYAAAANSAQGSVQFSSIIGMVGVYREQERLFRTIGDDIKADALKIQLEQFMEAHPKLGEALDAFDLRRSATPPMRRGDDLHPPASERARRLKETLQGGP
jgi:hypothetical protein